MSSTLKCITDIKHKLLIDISDEKITKKEINEILSQLSDLTGTIEKISEGKLKYCKKCKDYYYKESFFTYEEVKEERILTYISPINSGGNESRDGKMKYTYKMCPKGHREFIGKEEY